MYQKNHILNHRYDKTYRICSIQTFVLTQLQNSCRKRKLRDCCCRFEICIHSKRSRIARCSQVFIESNLLRQTSPCLPVLVCGILWSRVAWRLPYSMTPVTFWNTINPRISFLRTIFVIFMTALPFFWHVLYSFDSCIEILGVPGFSVVLSGMNGIGIVQVLPAMKTLLQFACTCYCSVFSTPHLL